MHAHNDIKANSVVACSPCSSVDKPHAEKFTVKHINLKTSEKSCVYNDLKMAMHAQSAISNLEIRRYPASQPPASIWSAGCISGKISCACLCQVTPHAFLYSDSRDCSDAGKQLMLQKRGNAIDALVSIIICLSVKRPDVISIGGCGALIVHKRDTNKNELFDAMCTSPADLSGTGGAAASVGVPGLVAGLKEIHQTYGYIYWKDLFQPALDAAENGFQAHPEFLLNVERVKATAPPAEHIVHEMSKMIKNGVYPPQLELAATLRALASDSADSSLYSGSIGRSIVSTLGNAGVLWDLARDLSNYTVEKPNPIVLDMAGFSLSGFPSPFAGGTLATSVLANLDMLNHRRPLDAHKLSLGDTSELSTLYHRLIELAKFGVGQISRLGDPYDRSTGPAVSALEQDIVNTTQREALVERVVDTSVLPMESYGPVEARLFGGSGANAFSLTVESDMLIASATLVMGAPFGSGIVTPDTGILLNGAQTLFFSPNTSGVSAPLNLASPGRRPLVPASPVFFQTAQQKCGHRFIAASSGGLRGVMELSQVLMSSFLYLSNVTCSVLPAPGGTGSAGVKVASSTPTAKMTTEAYTPAVGQCLPLNASLALKRLFLDHRPDEQGGIPSFVVVVEPGFPGGIVTELESRGHRVIVGGADSSSNNETEVFSRIAATGWTMYTTLGAADESSWNTTASF